MRKYRCRYCSHVYDEALGDPDSGIAPGTKYEDIPDDWMCPECNQIHHPTECSTFTGLQYPKCCRHHEGHRLDDGIRTGG